MSSKRKPKWRWMKFRKNDPTHNLFVAAQRWIHAKGGTAVVMSGPEIQDWGEGLGKYRVALQIVGRAPKKEAGR
jgi:hypothetical protein